MLKKILVGAALASAVSVAAANPAPYVGASLGVTNNSFNAKVEGTEVTGGTFRGAPVSLFAGYGGVVADNFYFAGEVFGTPVTGKISRGNSLKTTYSYGASVLPGVMLSDHTLAYGRLGLIRSRFSEQSTTRDGAQFGLGMQTSLTQNVDLRGEYDFVAYKSFDELGVSIAPRADQFSVGLVYKFD